jgi:glycine/D-amino acid oxidase-like deaminating enzyme
MLIQTLALKCKNPIPWTTGDVPDDFQFHLFYDAWDHPAQHMEHAIARVLALNEAGVKQMINGPKSFTPDGNFILGLAPDCANMFVGTGFNAFGIASGGGAGAMGDRRRIADGPDRDGYPSLLRPPPPPQLGLRADARCLWQVLHDQLPA